MKGQTHGGKGSAQRPSNYVKYADNYDAIFKRSLKINQRKKKRRRNESVSRVYTQVPLRSVAT